MNVAIVLVTYNRLEKLKLALDKYESQTKLPKYILVVNNASTDSTANFLDKWKNKLVNGVNKIVLTTPKNLGGSGGFAFGIKEACHLECDFLFLADDDAMAEKNMLEELNKGYRKLVEKRKKVAALCTSILNYNSYEYMHRCIVKKGLFDVKFKGVPDAEYDKEYFKIDILTFVGACINKNAIKKIGNVKQEYFIYFDDSEFSMRLNKVGDIYCIPASIMHHDVGTNRGGTWKDYYDTRNWIDMVKEYYPRRILYGSVLIMYLKRCSLLAVIIKKRNPMYRIMCKRALRDGLQGNLGLNEIYTPGKKI